MVSTTARIPASTAPEWDDSPSQRVPADEINHGVHKYPLVSVIIACYNSATFLEEALRSALVQSYPAMEVVVVDDGSTDGSPEIAERWPVRCIRQENRGTSEARNVGIRECKGSYVVFLDADDRLRPEAVQCGLQSLEQHPDCAIAVGDHVFISAAGSLLANSTKVSLSHSYYEALLKSNFIEVISSVLFRRSIFDEVGGFDSTLAVAEDYELYLRIARARPVCCHPGIVAEYRKHKANTSLNSELMLTTTLGVLRGQAEYIGADPGRLQAFREGLRRWRKQYGRQLARELARSYSSLSANHFRRKLLLLANHYPQGLLMLMLLRIMPALGQRHPPAPCFRELA